MVSYSVNASTPSDFSQTIAFAKAKNVRLVIRNTGHEYVATSLRKFFLVHKSDLAF